MFEWLKKLFGGGSKTADATAEMPAAASMDDAPGGQSGDMSSFGDEGASNEPTSDDPA